MEKGCENPLPIAAHFGLEAIITDLLGKEKIHNYAGTRGQALVEAVRMGELPALRALLKSYPLGLDFGDVYL